MEPTKHVSYALTASTSALIPQIREANKMTNAGVIAAGVELLSRSPELLADIPEQAYGSGRKPKVFNLPIDTDREIRRLAGSGGTCTMTHVVDVAIRNLADNQPSAANPMRGKGKHLLEMVRDVDLLAEVRRRGLIE